MNPDSIAMSLRKISTGLIVWSLVTFVCGVLAIVLSLTFSFSIAVAIGLLVLIAGVGHLVFAFHMRSFGGFLWQILLCALYELAAIFLLANPLLSLLSLTLVLASFLLLEGALEVGLYFRLKRFRHAVWILLDGIGTLIVGIVMVRQWPPASPEIVGALVGISLMLSAFSRLMFSLLVRRLNPVPA